MLAADAPCGALSGPSFALEVARGLPTALDAGRRGRRARGDAARELHQQRLRVYFSDDVAGVEVGGAVKNVMAIATGIADGLASARTPALRSSRAALPRSCDSGWFSARGRPSWVLPAQAT